MIGAARRIDLGQPGSPDTSPAAHHTSVRQVNHYRLDAHVGKGSSGGVFLATDCDTGNRCAVKRVRLKTLYRVSSGIAQLERKIRLMRTLSHPNILKVLEVIYVESVSEAFMVMDYAEKGYLSGYISRGIKISISALLSIAKQVLSAMFYLHEKGLVRQNIAPASLLVDSGGRAIMADLGIGHSFQSAGTLVELPAFQAPEALDDWSDGSGDDGEDCPEREDVWALGVTLYQLLYLRLPFPGETVVEIVANAKAKPLEIPEETDPGIVALLQGMLKVNPKERLGIEELLANPLIKGAKDFADDLPTVVTPEVISGTTVTLEGIVCPVGYSFVTGGAEEPGGI
jgi:serine/threonine protein kinase